MKVTGSETTTSYRHLVIMDCNSFRVIVFVSSNHNRSSSEASGADKSAKDLVHNKQNQKNDYE